MKNKKRPFIVRFIRVIIAIVLTLAILMASAAGVGYGILKFKYDVDAFELIRITSALPYDRSKMSVGFTNEDKNSVNDKVSTLPFSPVTRFTGKELAAYIAQKLDNSGENTEIDLGFGNVAAKDYDLSLISLEFTELTAGESTCVTVKAELSYSSAEFKKKMKGFPYLLVSDKIPDLMREEVTFFIYLGNDGGYTLGYGQLALGGLNAEQTETLMLYASSLQNYTPANKMNLSAAKIIAGYLFSEDGDSVYSSMKDGGAVGYGFNLVDGQIQLEIYDSVLYHDFTVNYSDEYDAENPNATSYRVSDGIIELANLHKTGYVFEGWYDTGTDEIIFSIDAASAVDYNLEARWSLEVYTITYDLNGGVVDGENPTEYTIETESFTLIAPEKEYAEFNGWSIGGSAAMASYTVIKGTYGDIVAIALFDDITCAMDFYVDGELVFAPDVKMGTLVTADTIGEILVPEELGLSGYDVKKWYLDSALSNPLPETGAVLLDDLELYGNWQYLTDKILFYNYIEKFDAALVSESLSVTNFDELTAFVDYVIFYDITKKIDLYLNYPHTGINYEINRAFDRQKRLSDFAAYSSYTLGTEGMYGVFYATANTRDMLATESFDADGEYTYPQQKYAFERTAPALRGNTFDDFKINNVKRSVRVRDSEQLWFVLEQGYLPVCEANSPAEKVYEKAKSCLKRIISDDMDDVEKTRAIYEWLILNVCYDNYAVGYSSTVTGNSSELKKYKSWAAEGVFDDGVAVCEGFSKALIIMARIEGIPALYVTGNNHAWNRVLIGGKWYGVDATHGNLIFGGSGGETLETVTYSSFLFTDANKTARGFTSADYIQFKAETVYDYYSSVSLGSGDGSISLYAENDIALSRILSYAKKKMTAADSKYTTFEFSSNRTINSLAFGIKMRDEGLGNYLIGNPTTDSAGHYVYVVLVKN